MSASFVVIPRCKLTEERKKGLLAQIENEEKEVIEYLTVAIESYEDLQSSNSVALIEIDNYCFPCFIAIDSGNNEDYFAMADIAGCDELMAKLEEFAIADVKEKKNGI